MEISPQRREAVEKARQAWIKKLIDLSRRNNLLFYRPLKWGTLSLSLADPSPWAALLRGGEVPLKSLAENTTSEELSHKAIAIWRRALENQEEKGLATMFIALGMVSWKAADDGRNSQSPALLLPVGLEIKGHSGTSLSVQCVGQAQANLVLLHVLESEFGISIPSEKMVSPLQGSEEEESFNPAPVYELLRQSCSEIPEFEVQEVAVLGNFAFQKMAMVRDLQSAVEALAGSDIVAALAGDAEAKANIGEKTQNPDPKQFDTIPPKSEFLILDADWLC